MAVDRKVDHIGVLLGNHSKTISFQAMIADLIDNCIDAGASEAGVFFNKNDYGHEHKLTGLHTLVATDDPTDYTVPPVAEVLHGERIWLMIIDDGDGMDSDDLFHALGLGTRRKYEEWHLGKYGMGMKQSSRSHAQEITILSKKKNGNGEIAILRDSTYWTLKTGKDQLMVLQDIEEISWMIESEGYKTAVEMLSEQDHGTVVLLEGLHKLEIEQEGIDRQSLLASLQERVESFLGLTFQKYLQEGGAKIELSERGDDLKRKIKCIQFAIYVQGNDISLIDPFEQHLIDDTGYGTLTSHHTVETIVNGNSEPMNISIHILPNIGHERYKSERDKLDGTKRTRVNADGSMTPVGESGKLQKSKPSAGANTLQGMYIFRNQRLIDYAGEDVWKSVRAIDAKQTHHRWEVHLPPGLHVGTRGPSEWVINDTKDRADPENSLVVRMKQLMSFQSKQRWHSQDPSDYKPNCASRADTRLGKIDNRDWPSQNARWGALSGKKYPCESCNSWEHQITAHTCTLCGKTGHQGPHTTKCDNYVPLTPTPPPPPTPIPPPGPTPPGPNPPLPTPDSTELSGNSAQVRKRTDGKFITVKQDGGEGEVVIYLDSEHPGFEQLVASIVALNQSEET